MRNKRKKIKKTSQWADLPQDILGLIRGKLVDVIDLIRFDAVWRIDIPKDTRNLPWLCNLSWAKGDSDHLECEIYDPYSRRIFFTSKFVSCHRYTRSYSRRIKCLASSQGWLIASYYNHYLKWEMFMYNPYSKEFISLPFMWKYEPRLATFSGNPVSKECRVFIYLINEAAIPCIASYSLNGDKEWEMESLAKRFSWCLGMQCANEQLFCLFGNGFMVRYNFADGSWTWNHELRIRGPRLWLSKGEGDLIVLFVLRYKGTSCSCSTFYFDWSNMRWVGLDLQESTAVFVSGNLRGGITTFVRPFIGCDDLENKKDCKVYFFDHFGGKKEPSNYSFEEMRKFGKRESMVFIEPPRLN